MSGARAAVLRRAVWLASLCLLAGCTRHKPVIYLDHEWSLYYARNSCYLYLPRGDRDPGLEACLTRQTRALKDFERALLADLGVQPACAGVMVAGDPAPPATGGFWRLLVSLDDPEGKREPWDLMSPGKAAIQHGAGNAGEVTQEVCAIVNGRAPREKPKSQAGSGGRGD